MHDLLTTETLKMSQYMVHEYTIPPKLIKSFVVVGVRYADGDADK